MRWLLCLSLLVPLSGCLSHGVPGTMTAPPGRSAADTWRAVNQAMEGVPCQAPFSGSRTESTANLKLLSAIDLPASRDGPHGELDARGELAVHARSAGGFEVYGIADPLHPQHLGNFTDAPSTLDVKFAPDNRTVLVGTPDGIVLASLADPRNATQVGAWSFRDAPIPPSGLPGQVAHMLATARIGGTDWAFVAPTSGTGVWVLRIEGTPQERRLAYVAQTLPAEGGPLGPHDLYVQKDALDAHWYLYSADGFHGWTVFNVDNPEHPIITGAWANPAEGGFTHSIQAQAINGKRIVATVAEKGANFLRVYDATDWRTPLLLGQFQADSTSVALGGDLAHDPLNSTGPAATHPQHDLNIVAGTLFLAYYSYGLYVFDLAAFVPAGPSVPLARSLALQPVAHWAAGPGAPEDGPLATNRGYWDAIVQDGIVYVSWIDGGLLALGYGCHTPLPNPALTSTG